MLEIITDPKRLSLPSREVDFEELMTEEFQDWLDNMSETMERCGGVGIAAPQLGKNMRAIAVLLMGKTLHLINPKIVRASLSFLDSYEGCLSFPGLWGTVKRHANVCVEAFLRDGNRIRIDAVKEVSHKSQANLAVVLQHEIDHLDGITLPMRLKKLQPPK